MLRTDGVLTVAECGTHLESLLARAQTLLSPGETWELRLGVSSWRDDEGTSRWWADAWDLRMPGTASVTTYGDTAAEAVAALIAALDARVS